MIFKSSLYILKRQALQVVEKVKDLATRCVDFFRVQFPAQYNNTKDYYFKKVASESGILPEKGQPNPPPDDQIDISVIKAFNLKLRNDLIRQKIGR